MLINKTTYKPQALIALLLCCAALLSCRQDNIPTGGNKNGDEREVIITMSVPRTVSSRSLPPETEATPEEDAVETVDLLLFDTDGKYVLTSRGRQITNPDPGVTSRVTFRVYLPQGEYGITVLANSRQLLFDCFPEQIQVGTELPEISQQLTAYLETSWNPDGTAGRIPMWGDIGTVTIDPSLTDLGNVQLYRAMARMDVANGLTDPTKFEITGVYLYNRYQTGTVIPDQDKFSTDIPSLKNGSGPLRGPLGFTGSKITPDNTGLQACIGQIYTFEAPQGSIDKHLENTCIVVGGKYDGPQGVREGYYRIDIKDYSLDKYLHVLRNHHYEVMIRDVTDYGKSTPDEAFESLPVGMEATIVDWNEKTIGDIGVGGNYIMRVSADELVFTPLGGTRTVYIYTDHPGGWKFGDFTTDWLTVSHIQGNPGETVAVTFTAPAYDQDAPRMVVLPVKVANVEKRISVVQQGLGDVRLFIIAEPSLMVFTKGGAEQTLNIDTYPQNSPLYFTYNGVIEWEEPGGFPQNGIAATAVGFKPKPNNTGNGLTGNLVVHISDEFGNVASANVIMRQVGFLEGFEYRINNPYPAVAGDYTFEVKSLQQWELTSQSVNWWQPKFVSPQDPSDWKQHTFTFTEDNPLYEPRQMEILVTLDNGDEDILTFEQDFTEPFIHVTSTDFDITGQTQTLTIQFETNSDWYIDYDAVPTNMNVTVSPASGTVQTGTGGMADQVVTGEITITATAQPYSIAAGTEMTLPITIHTSNTDPHPGNEESVTVKRITPVWWELIPVRQGGVGRPNNGPFQMMSLMYEQTNVVFYYMYALKLDWPTETFLHQYEHRLYVYGSSNASWQVWTSLNESDVRTVSAGDSRSGSFIIPENDTGSPRPVTIYVRTGDEIKEFVLTQDYWDFQLTVDMVDNESIPTGGRAVYFTVTGTRYPKIFATVAFHIAGDSGSPRFWDFSSYDYTHLVIGDNSTTPRWEGSGTATGYIVLPGNRNGEDVEIDIYWGFRHYGLADRKIVSRAKYNTDNYELQSTNRIVSRDGMWRISGGPLRYRIYETWYRNGLNWMTAGALEDNFKAERIPDEYYYPYSELVGADPDNPGYSCNTYSEPDDGGARWRLPTIEEMEEMYQYRDVIGGFDSHKYEDRVNSMVGYYWTTGYEYNGNTLADNYSYAMYMIPGMSYSGKPTSFLKQSFSPYTRCVRNRDGS